MCDLPSRRSVGCIYIAECYPDEADMAGSLPQQYYMSTMTCWTDPADDLRMRKWMYDQYSKVSAVGVGQYVADYDVTHRRERVSLIENYQVCAHAKHKLPFSQVMTDTSLRKWLKIRAKWDPDDRFPGYKNFAFADSDGVPSKI